MGLRFFLLLFVCILPAAFGIGSAKKSKERSEESESGSDLLLPKPFKHIKTKAGRVLVWPDDTKALEEIGVRSMIIELDSKGLVLPMYVDADSLCYVLQGRASAGIIRPSGVSTNTRYVRTGDVVALPAGWMVWLWNTGGMKMKMFCVNKPRMQEDCKSCSAFFLAGGNQTSGGSFLRGFSDQVLSRMFDLDMKEARSVAESQDKSVIIKTENALKDLNDDDYYFMQGDLAFNMETARPEIMESGGRMTLLDDTKMRILKELSFGAVLVKLNPQSMASPQWLLGSGQIVYVTKGEGRVEVTNPDGQAALSETLEAGDAFVVPPFHPHVAMNNGSSPMEFICIHFTSGFYPSFLSGQKSVYRSIPIEYLAASFNTSEEIAQKLRRGHASEKMFFKLDQF